MKVAQDAAKEVENAAKTANENVEKQIAEQTTTLESQYQQHQVEVNQLLEQRHEAAVEAARHEALIRDLNNAQIKLVADAQRAGTTTMSSHQMNEFGN